MNVAKFKKILVLFSTLFILNFSLLGFVYPNVQTTLDPDGSGTIVVDVGIDSKFVNLAEQEIGQELWQLIEQNLPKGLKLQTYQQDKLSHYKVEIKFDHVSKLTYRHPQTGKVMRWPIQLETEDKLFYVNYHFQEKIDLSYKPYLPDSTPPQIKKILSQTTLVYQVVLPGTIVRTNAKWRSGSYASWQLNLGDKTTLKAKSQVIRWRLVLLTGILILVIIGVIGMWVIKLKARQEKPSARDDA